MSTDRDTTRIVRSWLRTDEQESADRVLDAVLDRLDTTPQRRATWWPARRLPIMNNYARLALAAAAVAVAAVIGYSYFGGGNVGGPGIDTESPTQSPASTPAAIPFSERALEPGRYALGDDYPVGASFDVPSGWISCSSGAMEQAVCRLAGREFPGIGVAFVYVENVAADPCEEQLLEPPIGPTVDDLVTAISNLEGFDATAPEDVTIDGFDAKRFTLTAPDDPPCDVLITWATPNRTNGIGPGEINLLHVVDVDGVRILISSAYFADAVTPADLAAVDELLGSIDLEP